MFLTKRFYILVLVVILLLGGGYLFGSLFIIGQLGLLALLLADYCSVRGKNLSIGTGSKT